MTDLRIVSEPRTSSEDATFVRDGLASSLNRETEMPQRDPSAKEVASLP
jgi:hypothetical protein